MRENIHWKVYVDVLVIKDLLKKEKKKKARMASTYTSGTYLRKYGTITVLYFSGLYTLWMFSFVSEKFHFNNIQPKEENMYGILGNDIIIHKYLYIKLKILP